MANLALKKLLEYLSEHSITYSVVYGKTVSMPAVQFDGKKGAKLLAALREFTSDYDNVYTHYGELLIDMTIK